MPTRQEMIVAQSREWVARLVRRFQAATVARIGGDREQGFRFLTEADDFFQPHLEQIARVQYDAAIAGRLAGALEVVEELPAINRGSLIGPPDALGILYPPGEEPVIDFPVIRRATEQIAAKRSLDPATYYGLRDEARRQAFTITAGLKTATIEKVREILQESAEGPVNRTAFEKTVRSRLREELPISDAHLEQVFRNNVNGSYSDGVEGALGDPVVGSAFPFRAYHAIHDDRARPEHRALENLGLSGTNVFFHLDPVWALFRPPWDWNCRCGFTPITIRQAARKGVAVAQQWLETGIQPSGLFVPRPPFLPSPSWRRIAA